MTFEEILRDIHARRFQPVYFLHGEEPYFIDRIEAAIDAHALSDAEKGFNLSVLYGKEVDHLTLLDYLRRYPMMSERQVVIVREAQEMKGLTELASYMENPMLSTVFVVCHKYKKVDMRTKFGKALQGKNIVLFESKKLYDNQVADWITGFCKSKKLAIEPSAAALLAEYLGTDLAKISNELEKLALNLPAGTAVTPAHVQEYVGISKDYNVFELQKAFALRDLPKIARIREYFADNIRKNPLIVTISSLFAYFSKVYMLHSLKGSSDAEVLKALDLRSDWFLKEYKIAANNYNPAQTMHVISLLKEYDLRSKGVDTDTTNTGEEELMKELFWKILN
ncbi:MAG TPA: DNA polymerase III subunit delta [Saprospiraceae bacterium]|nr:DNA polymerase III subunit delta [Saprospiraceae bacterium]